MAVIESAGITDVGSKRDANQDALLLDEERAFYVVADGMGGHRAGETASRMVVEILSEYMQADNDPEEAAEDIVTDASLSIEANRLLFAIREANLSVYQSAQENKDYRGMGSTVSAIHFKDTSFTAANVGDSPIFLVHAGEIEQISVPHTVAAEHAVSDPEDLEPLEDRFHHMLTRAMGTEAAVEPDIFEIQYFAGDMIVIASDGLTDLVPPEEILDMVQEHNPETACSRLVELANQRGGKDNITVIVINVKQLKEQSAGIKYMLLKIWKGMIRLFQNP